MREFKYIILLLILLFTKRATYSQAVDMMGMDVRFVTIEADSAFLKCMFYVRDFSNCSRYQGFCAGGNGGAIKNNPALNYLTTLIELNIPDAQQYLADVSLSCNNCNLPPVFPVGSLQEAVQISDTVYIPNDPPLIDGWAIEFQAVCNRDTVIDNFLMHTQNSLRSHIVLVRIFTYKINGIPVLNSSPVYYENPVYIVCAGKHTSLNAGAYDPDGDSLVFSFIEPLGTVPSLIYPLGYISPYAPVIAPGYSGNSPLPSALQNPNNTGASLNTSTGEITFTSFTTGDYEATVKVKEYRQGILLSEQIRDIRFVIINCDSINNAPEIEPLATIYDTVLAGTSICLPVMVSDNDYLDPPWNTVPQQITITASGNEFGAGYNSTTSGCSFPPCATLNPNPPMSVITGDTLNFCWQTDCNHVQAGLSSATYVFTIKARDNYCPLNAETSRMIVITVLAPPKLPSAELHCVSVDSVGQVVLNWVPATDTLNSFISYAIWRADSINGAYSAIGTVSNINSNSYFDNSANASNNQYSYFIQTLSGCNYSANSDTLSNILLHLNNNGTAELSWNPVRVPLLSSSNVYYQIYRRILPAPWQLIDSTMFLNYIDSVSACNETVCYRVEIYDSVGCVSSSNHQCSLFSDIFAPPTVLLDSVSVTSAGNAIISWHPLTTPDVIGYCIYMDNGSGFVMIDTVWGNNSSSYINLNSVACQQSECYSITAFDSCGNSSPLSEALCTINLNLFTVNCQEDISLNWNYYNDSSIDSYSIYSSVNSSPFALEQVVSPSNNMYTDTSVISGLQHCYFIRANTNNGSSTSCIRCVVAGLFEKPDYNYLRLVTVTGVHGSELRIFSDTSADINYFKILRKNSILTFDSIGFLLNNNQINQTYFDLAVNTENQAYQYKIVSIDGCGNSDTSNFGTTILLKAEAREDFVNKLVWNEYNYWTVGVQKYVVSRYLDGVFNSDIEVINLGSPFYEYLDDVSEFYDSNGEICYLIKAIENENDSITQTQDTSISNIVCVQQLPHIFIPNAFHPGGLNNVFFPVIYFGNITEYNLMIFTRWGEQIFESSTVSNGWDGTYKENPVQQGVYVYRLMFKNNNGDLISKIGSVTLVR